MFSEQNYHWESLYKYGTRQFFKEKSTIYKENTYGKGFYFIHNGLVKILTSTLKGNERLLNIGVPGQTLGIQAIDQNHYVTTAVAAKDSVLYYFTFEQITKLVQDHPGFLSLITDTVNQNTNTLIQTIYLDTMTTVQRISFALLMYYKELKKNNVYFTMQDVTKCTGLTRVTVSKVLKEWELEGMICMEGRKLKIIRPELLETYVQGA